jgi:hypothetical protein
VDALSRLQPALDVCNVRKHMINDARCYATLFDTVVADATAHGVGFAAACLAIRQNSAIVALHRLAWSTLQHGSVEIVHACSSAHAIGDMFCSYGQGSRCSGLNIVRQHLYEVVGAMQNAALCKCRIKFAMAVIVNALAQGNDYCWQLPGAICQDSQELQTMSCHSMGRKLKGGNGAP